MHPECEFRVAQHMGLDMRLDILAQRMIEQTRHGKATMSCDMCQYRIPLFGREALVGLPQISDHAHGLRGTTMNNHIHEGHLHSHHEEHKHEHGHTHDHSHPSSLALNTWKELCECITTVGIMTMQEITAALTAWQKKRRNKQAEMALMPYILPAMPGQPPTAALRWDFDSRRARDFANWCMTALRERFGITWQIEYKDEDVQLGPPFLYILQDGQQEQCDWRYLNESRWMGAFCTIANRLLASTDITALCLETGWLDTVLVFSHKYAVQELLNWFPQAE
jgi:hypothetical protein